VVSAYSIKNSAKKISKSFGFVEFKDETSTHKVLKIKQHFIKNRQISCEIYKKRGKRFGEGTSIPKSNKLKKEAEAKKVAIVANEPTFTHLIKQDLCSLEIWRPKGDTFKVHISVKSQELKADAKAFDYRMNRHKRSVRTQGNPLQFLPFISNVQIFTQKGDGKGRGSLVSLVSTNLGTCGSIAYLPYVLPQDSQSFTNNSRQGFYNPPRDEKPQTLQSDSSNEEKESLDDDILYSFPAPSGFESKPELYERSQRHPVRTKLSLDVKLERDSRNTPKKGKCCREVNF